MSGRIKTLRCGAVGGFNAASNGSHSVADMRQVAAKSNAGCKLTKKRPSPVSPAMHALHPKSALTPVSYTPLTLPTNREVYRPVAGFPPTTTDVHLYKLSLKLHSEI